MSIREVRSARPKLGTPACPRQALAAAVDQVADGQTTYAALSRMIGRSSNYLGRFVTEGVPLALSERDHRMLVNFFGRGDRALGIRDLWMPLAA